MFRLILTDDNDKQTKRTVKTEKAAYRSIIKFLEDNQHGTVTLYSTDFYESYDYAHMPEL